MVRLRRDMDPEGNIMDPMDYILPSQVPWPPPGYVNWLDSCSFNWENSWPAHEEERLVRYRRSSNGTYQEVWELPNGHTWYGLYMPEGFIPPPGMGE
jgi:hypothetical protein